MSDSYDDLLAAVRAAALASRDKYGNKQEAMSIIYEKAGKFYFTEPHGEGANDREVKTKVQIPKGSARYIVHNHPEAKDNQYFSSQDLDTAERLGVPSAIIFGKDGILRTYTPGVTETTKRRNPTSRRRDRVSLGDQFAGILQ